MANFSSSVIDVPFGSSSANAMLEFAANTEAIPPVGTAVKVIITPTQGAERADHARVTIHIDRLGRIGLDGRAMAVPELSDWAGRYLKRHSKGLVVIRAEARALADDIRRVREELELAGVREITQQLLAPDGPILPRTAEQAKWSLDWWDGQFANPQRPGGDPAELAEALDRQIDRQIRQMEALEAMWRQYRLHLREALAKYKATTQPASDELNKPLTPSGGE